MRWRWGLMLTMFVATAGLLGACGSNGPDNAASPADTQTVDTAPASTSEAPTSEATPAATVASTTSAPATTTPSTTTSQRPVPEGELAFSSHVLPVLETMCAQCHTGNGPGTAHMRIDSAAQVAANADIISASVITGEMPPWPASALSVEFSDQLLLADHEVEAIRQWAQQAELDVDPQTVIQSAVGVVGLDEPDMVLVPDAGYDGYLYEPDQYRCYIYDPGFTEPQWLTAYEFVPDQTEIVHHAIGYKLPASARPDAEALDAESPQQGGWPCFGGSGVRGSGIFLGWAPGQGPTALPEGSGLAMQPGDFIVIQVHYHFEVDAPADLSSLAIELADAGADLDPVNIVEFLAPAEIPCSSAETGPLCDRDQAMAAALAKYGDEGVLADTILAICRKTPADFAHMTEGLASAACDLPMRERGTIVSVLGHQHELGASFRMTLNPDTPDERVLLDIPEWDFDWQYNYYPVEQIDVAPSDMVRIECTWDRSLRDPSLEPAYVLWADGTDDEMCFATIVIREG
ncbi:MAG: hypothetical protein R2770_07695 [Acidimicrobiales bacterium]